VVNNIKDLEKILGKIETVESLASVEVMPTGLMGLDSKVLHGGLPRGRYIELYSKESSGKSTVALFLVSMVQKLGGRCVWFESEGTLTKEYAEQCGVDTSSLEIVRDFTTGEDCLYKVKQRLALDIYDLIVLDSNTKLIPEYLREAKAEKHSQYDNLQAAKMNADFFRSLSGFEIRDINGNLIKSDKVYFQGTTRKETWHKLSDKKTCMVFIFHAVDDLSALSPGAVTTAGGGASKFEASIRLALKLRGTEKDSKGNLIYKKIDVIAPKNKMGPPFGYTRLLLYTDGRIEEECGDEILIDLGINKKIIEQSGGWFTIGTERFQGKKATIAYINNNLDLKNEILRG
jgi:recombination protein RecA